VAQIQNNHHVAMPGSTDELDILILGPVPPPFGGIAVHVSRLVPLLEKAGLRVGVLNHFRSTEMLFVLGALKRNPLNYYRLPKKFPARLVHYHHSRWSTLMAVAVGKSHSGARYVLTIHSGELRDRLNSRVPLIRRATRWALRRFDAIIVVNSSIRAVLRDHVDGRHIEVLPAFLAAVDEHSNYEPSIESFFTGGCTLVVPAYRISFLSDRRDAYGLDIAVKAFVILAQERPELRLAFFIAEPPSRGKARHYFSALERQLQQAGLIDRVLVAFGLPLIPAFRHDVIVVRPTRTEGDAVSVREALQADVPVVASDTIDRPQGVVMFSGDDVADLCAALRQILERPSAESERNRINVNEAETAADPFLDRLIRIYRAQLDSD
jgi:glycosyltransferase involved in cell wall biosynthesis